LKDRVTTKSNSIFAEAFSHSSWVYMARTKTVAAQSKPRQKSPMQNRLTLGQLHTTQKAPLKLVSPLPNIRTGEKRKNNRWNNNTP